MFNKTDLNMNEICWTDYAWQLLNKYILLLKYGIDCFRTKIIYIKPMLDLPGQIKEFNFF